MSCDDPYSGDCAKALARLEFFIDHELAEADSGEIQRHLEECGPCLDSFDLERAVKALVARSCTEHAPEALRQRVLVRLRQVQIRITD